MTIEEQIIKSQSMASIPPVSIITIIVNYNAVDQPSVELSSAALGQEELKIKEQNCFI